MKFRKFGNTNKEVSEIGLGTWQLGTKWGDEFNEDEALKILDAANKSGITFIDTADVYNGGKSEETIGKYIKSHPNKFFITTKCGRKLNPHTEEMYTPEAIEKYIDKHQHGNISLKINVNNENIGIIKSVNNCIRMSTGDYITFVDIQLTKQSYLIRTQKFNNFINN